MGFKRSNICILLLLSVSAAGISCGDVYEGFAYPANASIDSQNGGSGWSGGWGTPGGLDATVTLNSLGYGLLATSGGALTTAGGQPPNQGSSVATWVRGLGTPLGADNTTIYFSFLLRPETGFGFYGGWNIGGAFVGRSGDQSFYGLEGASNNIALSSVAPAVNQTALFVLRVDFLNGPERLSLYVNPTIGASEPATPDVLKIDLNVDPVNSLTFNNYGGYTTDELRIGDSFQSVTPMSAVPEPSLGSTAAAGLVALLGVAALRRR